MGGKPLCQRRTDFAPAVQDFRSEPILHERFAASCGGTPGSA